MIQVKTSHLATMRQAIQDGCTIREIANKLGWGYQKTYRAIRHYLGEDSLQTAVRYRIGASTRAKIASLYHEGHSQFSIAIQVRHGTPAVRRVMNELGLTIKGCVHWSQEELATLRGLLDAPIEERCQALPNRSADAIKQKTFKLRKQSQ
jgi:hypothetical protein